jgi:hypothetical protein
MVGYLRVVRVSNETIWAGVAAVVFGVLIASLLGGTGTPWIPILVVVALGFVVTTARMRREASRLRERYLADHGKAPAPHTTETATTSEPRRVEPPTTRARNAPASDATSLRRAGARAQSLGAKPQPPRREDRPD